MQRKLFKVLLVAFFMGSIVVGGAEIQKVIKEKGSFKSEFDQLNLTKEPGSQGLGYTKGSRSFHRNWSLAGHDDKKNRSFFICASDPENNRIVYLTADGATDKSPYIVKKFVDEYGDDLNIKLDFTFDEQGVINGFKYKWLTYINREGIVKIVDLISGERSVLFEGPVKQHQMSHEEGLHYFAMSDGIFVMTFEGTKVAKVYDGSVNNLLFYDQKLLFINDKNRCCAILKDGTAAEPPFEFGKIQTIAFSGQYFVYTNMKNDLYVTDSESRKKFFLEDSVSSYFVAENLIYREKSGALKVVDINYVGEWGNTVPWRETGFNGGQLISRPFLEVQKTDKLKFFIYKGRTPKEINLIEKGTFLTIKDTKKIIAHRISKGLSNKETPENSTSGSVAKVKVGIDTSIASNSPSLLGSGPLDLISDAKKRARQNIKLGFTQVVNASNGLPSKVKIDHGGPNYPGIGFFLKEHDFAHNCNGNLANGGKVNAIGDSIYFVNANNRLVRFKKSSPEILEDLNVSGDKNLTVHNGELFFLQGQSLRKYSNSSSVEIQKGVIQFCGVGNWILFVSSQDGSLQKMKWDGSEISVVRKETFSQLNSYNGLLFALMPFNESEDKLLVYNPLTQESKLEACEKAKGMILDKGRLFYRNPENKIMSIVAPRLEETEIVSSEGKVAWSNEAVENFIVSNNVIFATEIIDGKTGYSLKKINPLGEKCSVSRGPVIKGIQSSKVFFIGSFLLYFNPENLSKRINLNSGLEF